MIVDLLQETPKYNTRMQVGADGPFSIERVMTKRDYEVESWLMAHSLAAWRADSWEFDHRVFSIRDTEYGIPHATIVTEMIETMEPRSPFARCADLGVRSPFVIGGKSLRLMRVMGRGGLLAAPPYLRIARDWYTHHFGTTPSEHNWWLVEAEARYRGDSDAQYHEHYLLDESKNPWTVSKRSPSGVFVGFEHAKLDKEGHMIEAVA